jgi:hypothetical protein
MYYMYSLLFIKFIYSSFYDDVHVKLHVHVVVSLWWHHIYILSCGSLKEIIIRVLVLYVSDQERRTQILNYFC